MSRRRLSIAHLLALTLLGSSAASYATDLTALVQETQHASQEGQHLTLVWWLPQEFWQASLEANPNITPQGRAQVLAALDDYMVVALLRAKPGIGGLTDVQSKADLQANSRFEVAGKAIAPIAPDQLNNSAQIIIASLKPALAAMLGQMGQSIELLVYPAKHDGQRLIDPAQPGSLQYTLYDQTFHWRLPLASLLPKKHDAKSGEDFPGNYNFNPYTGTSLNAP